MIINHQEILPGETKVIDIHIAKLPSNSPIDISITVSRAKKPGPVLLFLAGMHGDEINGVEIVRRIIDQKIHKPTRGTVICIPVLNVYGFIHFSRYVPDGKDVNRSFPGNSKGSLAARIAHYLMQDIIPKIDYGVDFHTGGADRTNYPQIRAVLNDDKNLELANAFCAPFLLNSKLLAKSLRQSSYKLGKKIIVYEGGESSRFDHFAIEQGVNGAIRLMKHLNMTNKKVENPSYESKKLDSSVWVRAKVSGMFLSTVKYGEYVNKRQLIGYITDPFGGSVKNIKAPVDGFIIGLNNNPIMHQGDAVAHIGKP